MPQLDRRHVDAQVQRLVPAKMPPPCGSLKRGLTQHPAPKRHDQARLLGDRDKAIRRDDAEGGWRQSRSASSPTILRSDSLTSGW